MRIILAILFSLISFAASAQVGGSSNDLFVTNEVIEVGGSLGFNNLNNSGNYITFGKTPRTSVINPAVKTLVLIGAGASNGASVGPTAYTPTNAANIDNFNLYGGNNYAAADPLLGQTISALGPGSIDLKLADLLITNGSFNRVILASVAVAGTVTHDWAVGNLQDRICVMMRRLAEQGITPSTPGVTFAITWNIGENEHGETLSDYQALVNYNTSLITACGFVGRIFIPVETLSHNVTDATITSAQTGLVNNTVYWSLGNLDVLTGATNRQADGTHFTDAGQTSSASIEYTAMHASGAPF